MTKFIKKKKCEFKQGHIVKGNKVIGLPPKVWLELDKLELMLQEYYYLQSQDAYNPGPSLQGFKRESALEYEYDKLDMTPPSTPAMDARVEEAIAFMEDVDKVAAFEKYTDTLDKFKDLIVWAESDEFIKGTCEKPIDLYIIGNPLTLEPWAIAHLIKMMIDSPINFGPAHFEPARYDFDGD